MDWGDAPFTMGVKSIKMTDYSTGDQYEYSDQSCSVKSIKAKGGKINSEGSPDDVPEVGSPSPSSPTHDSPSEPTDQDDPSSAPSQGMPQPPRCH